MATAVQLAIGFLCFALGLKLFPASALHTASGEGAGSNISAATSAERVDLNGTRGDVKIDLYVINLKDRPERCRCIAKQLEQVGVDMYRQEGQRGNTCGLSPSKAQLADMAKAEGEAGLFCSNYRIWKSALKRNADFIIILEDDAVFHDGWMPKVKAMVNNCQQVDFVVVDPVWWGSAMKPTAVQGCSASPPLLLPVPDAWGTTMQLIRTSFLPKLIASAENNGWGAMDHWYKNHPDGHQAYVWQPRIVQQTSQRPLSLPSYCSQSNTHSDISKSKNLELTVSGGLGCPSQ